ncbi:helix-turn-helix transcriptional regulator [Streptomyces sp. NPDC001889]
MPHRHFDGQRLLKARRALDPPLTQAAVGQAVDSTRVAVGDWESGRSKPAWHKLPGLARFLRQPLNRLFPREGPPDLADLRDDAGIPLKESGRLIGRRSHIPVYKAESGVARLKPEYEQPLATGYGVTLVELRDAQDRSFGIDVPDRSPAPAMPETLAEKITHLLEHSYPGEQVPPTDSEIAQGINQYAGAVVVSEKDVEELRTGTRVTASPIVGEGLAEVFGVSALFFQSNDHVTRQVVEGFRLLATAREGDIGRAAARGLGEEGLSPEVLAFVNGFVAEMKEMGGLPRADGEEQ